MPHKMTYQHAVDRFVEIHIPRVQKLYEQDGVVDEIARSEEWNNYIDDLLTERLVPKKAEHWEHPPVCEGK